MGKPMVTRLLKAGFKLRLWNRTPSKMQCFASQAVLAKSVEEAIIGADIVITMLETGDIVNEVLYESGAFRGIAESTLVIDMSSIPPSTARQHALHIESVSAHYLDAPVSGGTIGAQEGTLAIMVGGEKPAFDRAFPMFKALGKATYIGKAGCGQLTKLANQAIVGITIGAVSEALLLASEGGADPAAVREALSGGFAASRILELHGQRMLDRNFEPGATSRVQLKDLRTILAEAANNNLSLPLSQRNYESYLSLVSRGYENLDHSGLLVELEHLNNTRLGGKRDA